MGSANSDVEQRDSSRFSDRLPRVGVDRLLGLPAILSLWLAFSGLVFYPVGDDWLVIADVESWLQQKIFLAEAISPQAAHWSPLWYLVNGSAYAISDYRFGMVSVGILKCVGVIVWVSAFTSLLRRATVPSSAITIVAILLLFHQGQVGILAQWKGIGAIFGNAFGFAAVAVVCGGLLAKQRTLRRGLAAAVFLLIAHLFKETTLAYTAFFIGAFLLDLLDPVEGKRAAWKLLMPSILISVTFVFVRYEIGASSTLADSAGPGTVSRYGIGGASDWALNQAYLVLATLTPISTLFWYSVSDGTRGLLLVVTAILNLALAAGLFFVDRRREIRLLVGWAIIGLLTGGFPVLLMRHVSEAYAGPLITWYCMLVSIAWCGFERRGWRASAIALISLLFALHLGSFVHKATRSVAAGRAEADAMHSAVTMLRTLPPQSTIYMDVSPQFTAGYSFYDPHPQDAIFYGIVKYRLPVRVVDSLADAEYLLGIRPSGRIDLTRR